MNDDLYIKGRNEDIFQERSSNEVDATIIDLLENNLTLHEEVRKLKREKKSNQSECVKSWNKGKSQRKK